MTEDEKRIRREAFERLVRQAEQRPYSHESWGAWADRTGADIGRD